MKKQHRFSIYSSPALDRIISARDGLRSRSALISAIADRYQECVKQENLCFDKHDRTELEAM